MQTVMARTGMIGLLLTLSAAPAHAQLGFLEGLFKNVEHVELGIGAARLIGETPLAPRNLRSFSAEVSFGAALRAHDSTDASPPLLGVEMALGYSQLTGFGAASSGYTLTGTVEELPSLVAYVALRPDRAISPYVGIRTGMARLQGFRAYVDDTVLHTATGSTYQFGGALGVAGGGEALQFFLEGNLMYRRFASVEWGAVANAVPPILPRTLPFSTAGISLGVQVMLR
jgi:opacity protein-like surface antigen